MPPSTHTVLDGPAENLDTALLEDGSATTRQVNEDGLAFANISGVIGAVDQVAKQKSLKLESYSLKTTRNHSNTVVSLCVRFCAGF